MSSTASRRSAAMASRRLSSSVRRFGTSPPRPHIRYVLPYRIKRAETHMSGSDALATVTRLLDATNAHDLEGIVGCFSPGYRNETPAHPLRGFTGAEQVRHNWSTILSSVPDLRLSLPGIAVDGDRVWTDMAMRGTRLDGTPHEMAGVVILTVREGLIEAARFFLEPVERATGDADAVIDEMFTAGARP